MEAASERACEEFPLVRGQEASPEAAPFSDWYLKRCATVAVARSFQGPRKTKKNKKIKEPFF